MNTPKRIREKRKVIEDSKNPKKIKRNPLFATFKSYNNVKKNLSIAANKFKFVDLILSPDLIIF